MEPKASQPLELSPAPFKPLNGDIVYSQKFIDLLSTLPKQKDSFGVDIYYDNGFWWPLVAVHCMIVDRVSKIFSTSQKRCLPRNCSEIWHHLVESFSLYFTQPPSPPSSRSSPPLANNKLFPSACSLSWTTWTLWIRLVIQLFGEQHQDLRESFASG